MKSIRSKLFFIFVLGLLVPAITLTIAGQSTDPNFPTPVEISEINGMIRARDIGDSRLTTFYYTFDGGQGDIFINVVTNYFSGDIDVFAADGQRPLAKMVIYADGGASETGRLVYLRKPERLVLRVQGRTPNDDPAVFRIKLGGSFIALSGQQTDEAPVVSRAGERNESGIRVNSVGTIIEVVPRPQATKPPPTAVVPAEPEETVSAAVPEKNEPITPTPAAPAKRRTPPPDVATVLGQKPATPKRTKPDPVPPPKAKAPPRTKTPPAKTAKAPVEPPVKKPDPLASIRLVVELKDGDVIERPMSEVVRFSVDKGVLTVVEKGGKTSRYSILDVAKVTIE